MSDTPLLDAWRVFSEGKVRDEALLTEFLKINSTAANVQVVGSHATVLYSGFVNGVKAEFEFGGHNT